MQLKRMNPDSKGSVSEDSFTKCLQIDDWSTVSDYSSQQSNLDEEIGSKHGILSEPDCRDPSKMETTTHKFDAQTKTFSFELSHEEWTSVQPRIGSKCLKGNWCNIFATKIVKFNPNCVFSFFYNHVSHLTSRKRKCPYFEGKAKCKIPTCHEIIELSISKEFIIKGVPTVTKKFA